MYSNITEQCKEIIARSSRTFTASFIMDEVEYTDIKSVKYNLPSANNGKITIGGTSSMTAEIIMENESIPAGKTIESYENVKMDDGTYESIPMGKFKIQKASTKDTLTTLIAAGPLTFATSQGYFSKLTYPTTTIQMLSEISEMIGIPIDTSGLEEISVETKPEGYTHREIIGYIAGMHGTNAYETREGGIAFHWYEHSDEDIFTDKTDSPEVGNSFFTVRKLQIETGSSTITRGDGTTGIYVSNPLMTEAAADIVWSKIGNFTYRPATFNVKSGTPCVDAWDSFTYDGNTVICTELSYSHDGGLQNVYKSANVDDTTSSGYKGPVAKAMERYYAELVLLKEAYIDVLTVDQADMRYAQIAQLDVIEANITAAVIANLEVEFMTVGQADLRYANIGLSNIDIVNIGEFMMRCGLITSATIIDGHVTGYLDSVEINANSITAGTLITDRLVFRGQEKSIVYELNNISNALQVVQSDTLNGEILTDRSITVDKIVARSITANEIAYNTITGQEILTQSITSREINVQELFAQDITATGTITGATLIGANADIEKGNIGDWFIVGGTIEATTNNIIQRSGAYEYDLTDVITNGLYATSGYLTYGKEKITMSADGDNVYLEFASLDELERNKNAFHINYYGVDKLVWNNDFTSYTTTTILGYLDTGIYTPKLSADRTDILRLYARDFELYKGKCAGLHIISSNTDDILTVEQTQNGLFATKIGFKNPLGMLGYLGVSSVNGAFIRFKADNSASYIMLDTGNYETYLVPKTGGQFTGRIQVPIGQGGAYIDSVTYKNRASIYVYNAASASSYHPIITAMTSSGHTWNLGAIGDVFGFSAYKADRTANGVDYYCWWDIAQGYMGTTFKVRAARIEFGSNYEYGLDDLGQVWASNVYLGNTKSIFCHNSEGNPIRAVMMASYDVLHLGFDASGIMIGNHGLTNDASIYVDNEITLNAPKVRIGEYNTAGQTSTGVALWSSGAVTIAGSVPELAFRYNNSATITSTIYESSQGTLTSTAKFRAPSIEFGSNYEYGLDDLGQVWARNIYVGKGSAYYVFNSSGTAINLIYMDTSNILRFGYGASDIWIGAYGTTTRMQFFASERIDLCLNCSGTSGAVYPALSFVSEMIYDQHAGANSKTGHVLRPTGTAIATNLGSSGCPFNMIYYQTLSQVSDKNDKKNIYDISDKYIALWDKLAIKTFRYINDDDKVRVGLIAQDVEQSAYEVGLTIEQCGFISKTWVVDEYYTGYKYGLDYLGIAMITAAKLKQIANIVNEHEKKIQEMQDKIAILSAMLLSMQQTHMA